MSVCPVTKTYPYSHFPPPQKRPLTHSGTHIHIPQIYSHWLLEWFSFMYLRVRDMHSGVELRPIHISKEINLLKPLSKNPEKFKTGCRDSPGCLSHHAEPGRVHKALSFLSVFFTHSLLLNLSKMSGSEPCTGLAELRTIEKWARERLLGSSREGPSFHDSLIKPSFTLQPSTVTHSKTFLPLTITLRTYCRKHFQPGLFFSLSLPRNLCAMIVSG